MDYTFREIDDQQTIFNDYNDQDDVVGAVDSSKIDSSTIISFKPKIHNISRDTS